MRDATQPRGFRAGQDQERHAEPQPDRTGGARAGSPMARLSMSGTPQLARGAERALAGDRIYDAAGTGRGAEAEAHRHQTVIRPWAHLLERAIATEVLPQMLANRPRPAPRGSDTVTPPLPEEFERFLRLILEDHLAEALGAVREMVERGVTREQVLDLLLTPTARRLGEMWETDQCDFTTVTLGMIRLNQIVRETASPISDATSLRGRERHLLIAAAPGEQHSFGVVVITDVFRRAGWVVQSEPMMTRACLMSTVRRNWFDVVGLSVSAERGLKGLPSVIRALRQTALNPALGVMVGGKAFVDHPERAQFVGADATARDAQEALFEADGMFDQQHELPG